MTPDDCRTAPGPTTRSWSPLGEGPYAQRLVRAYGEGQYDELITHPPMEAGLRAALEARRQGPSIDRQALIDGFRTTYKRAGLPVPNGVDTLAQEDTYVITTGQQLLIGGGPLYVAYKIQTAIALAKRASAQLGVPVLPIFWLAGEDDDLEEISTIRLGGREWRWRPPAQTAAGHLPLRGLRELFDEAGTPPTAWLREYLQRPTLAAAHTYLIDHWFGDQGLLILDPDQPGLKRCFAGILHEEVTRPFVKDRLDAATPVLTRLGLSPQLASRTLGLFLLDEQGHRLRLDPDEGAPDDFIAHYRRLSTPPQRWTPAQLGQLAQDHPERFSPNAALRPIYQEAILPGLAYVAGPSEMAYWWQLKGVFEKAGIPMPVVWPREQAVYVPSEVTEAGLPFSLEELLTIAQSTLEERLLALTGATLPNLTPYREALVRTYEQMLALADKDRPEYVALLAESTRQLSQFDRLGKRVIRAHRAAHARTLTPLRRSIELLMPGGHLQERTDSLLDYAIRYPGYFAEIREGLKGDFGAWRLIHEGSASTESGA